MSRFDELQRQHQSPEPDMDLLEAAARRHQGKDREQRARAAEAAGRSTAREPVEAEREADARQQRGGGADDGGGGSDAAGYERDDPDDGEHARSTAEPEEAAALEDEADEPDEGATEPEEPEAPDEEAPADDPVPEPAAQGEGDDDGPDLSALRPPTRPAGMADLALGPGKFEVEGGSKNLREFPEALLTALRRQLEPFGAEFARKASASTVVAGFVIARLGARVECDPNTEQAARAFKLAQPEISAVEGRLDALTDAVTVLIGQGHTTARAVRAASAEVSAVALAQAYTMADRIEQIGDLDSDTAGTAELDHPSAVAALRNMRSRSASLAADERLREGRPIR